MDRPTNRDFDDDDFRLPYGDGTDALAKATKSPA